MWRCVCHEPMHTIAELAEPLVVTASRWEAMKPTTVRVTTQDSTSSNEGAKPTTVSIAFRRRYSKERPPPPRPPPLPESEAAALAVAEHALVVLQPVRTALEAKAPSARLPTARPWTSQQCESLLPVRGGLRLRDFGIG